MPLVHIHLIKGKSPEYIRAVADGVHKALGEAFNVPQDDRFQLIHQHDAADFIYNASYLGIRRSDDLVILQIIAGNWRDVPTKQRLYRAIADNLALAPGLRQEDVMISLTGVGKEDWSFGNGLASYVDDGSKS
jgi:phenylpyruvate tautomerase PptA (4-oxalocrotonate tautomerase family)